LIFAKHREVILDRRLFHEMGPVVLLIKVLKELSRLLSTLLYPLLHIVISISGGDLHLLNRRAWAHQNRVLSTFQLKLNLLLGSIETVTVVLKDLVFLSFMLKVNLVVDIGRDIVLLRFEDGDYVSFLAKVEGSFLAHLGVVLDVLGVLGSRL
jgi:hypothetical protein